MAKYSDAERQAYNIGRGSVLPKDAKGREKMVRAAYGNNLNLINSYKRGRAAAQAKKDAYMKKVRSKSRSKKVF